MYFYLILILILIPVCIFTLIAGINGAASIPSPKKIVAQIVKIMKVKDNNIYYDLGSGTGKVLKEIALNNGKAVGFELAPLTYLLSKLLLLGKNNNIKVVFKNFYKENLGNASGIYCFLSPRAMNLLEPKFDKELKKGTIVVSYAFKLPNKKENHKIIMGKFAPIFVYNY